MNAGAETSVEYRDLPGFPGYRVGNDGSMITQWWHVHAIGRPGSAFVRKDEWRKMNQHKGPDGYMVVGINKRNHRVHRFVLLAFIGQPPAPSYECAHENGIRHDNRLCNLSWKTVLENHMDMVRHGTSLSGKKNPNCKLTSEDVREIRRIYVPGIISCSMLAKRFGVGPMQISRIVNKKRWKHL